MNAIYTFLESEGVDRTLLEGVRSEIGSFAGTAPQYDDITIHLHLLRIIQSSQAFVQIQSADAFCAPKSFK